MIWKRSTSIETTASKPISIDIKTKVVQSSQRNHHHPKINVDEYFATTTSLLEGDDEDDDIEKEEEQFIRVQSNRKHRVITSFGEKINKCNNNQDVHRNDNIYTEVKITVDDEEEGTSLLLGHDHDNDSKRADKKDYDEGGSSDISVPANSLNNNKEMTDMEQPTRFLQPQEDIVTASAAECPLSVSHPIDLSAATYQHLQPLPFDQHDISNSDANTILLETSDIFSPNKSLSTGDERGNAVTINGEGYHQINIFDDLAQEQASISTSEVMVLDDSFLRHTETFSDISTGQSLQKDEDQSESLNIDEEEAIMERASATSSSFFLRPTITVSRISQMIWRSGDARPQKYLQVSSTASPDRDEKISLWKF